MTFKRTLLALGLVAALLISGTTGAVAGKLITSRDIKDDTIRAKDLHPSLLKRIDKDLDTDTDTDTDTDSLKGLRYVHNVFTVNGNTSLTIECPTGLYAISGGAELYQPNTSPARIIYSNPTPNGRGWTARVDTEGDSQNVKVFTFCTPVPAAPAAPVFPRKATTR